MDGSRAGLALNLDDFPDIHDVGDRADGPGPALASLGVEDGFILLKSADGLPRMPAGLIGSASPARHYLVSLVTGAVKLVGYGEATASAGDEW